MSEVKQARKVVVKQANNAESDSLEEVKEPLKQQKGSSKETEVPNGEELIKEIKNEVEAEIIQKINKQLKDLLN